MSNFIEDGLKGGSLSPGSRLPTERQFAEMLGVSRAAVRKALSHHEASGSVIRHQGRGTFVAATEGEPPVVDQPPDWSDISPSEVMDVRSMFEPQIALLAARSATQRQVDRMQHCLVEAAAADTYEEFEVWDGALHRAIAEATNNRFLLRIFDQINSVRSDLRWGQLKRKSLSPERRNRYQRDHEAVVSAIRDRDSELARKAMADHLSRVRNNLLDPII